MPAVAGSVRYGNRGRLNRTRVPETTGPWRQHRRTHPRDLRLWSLPKAADFGRDRGLSSVVPLIRAFRTLGADFDRMLAAEFPEGFEYDPVDGERVHTWQDEDDGPIPHPPRGPGRPNNPGRWELATIAFVVSGYRSVQSFCHRFSGTGLWRECGFGDWEPDERTVRLHLEQIENDDRLWQAFGKVANALIRHAHSIEPRIGQVVFGDGTKWQSPALVKRVHPDNEGRRRWSQKNTLRRASEDDYQALHEKESAEPEDDEQSSAIEWEDEQGNVVMVESSTDPIRADDRRQYFSFNGVEYYALDTSSGLRKIVKQPGNRIDVWLGGIGFSLTDGLTGLRMSTKVFRADEQEYDHIPAAIEEVLETIGRAPLVVSVDKFSTTKNMYEYCSRRGIYLVGPYKGSRQRPTYADLRCDAFDEHKIPRCPHCGGEGDITGPSLGHYFDPDTEEPRVRARCVNQDSDECRAHPIFSEPCSVDWRAMTGLPMTLQLFHAIIERHQTWEAIFGNDRRRSSFAGKDTTGRLARAGIEPQRLRGEVSRMMDWFRVSLRHGWIDGWARRNTRQPVDLMLDVRTRSGSVKGGVGKWEHRRALAYRRDEGLSLPYGAVAERLGLVPPTAVTQPEGGEPPPDADAPA